MKVQYNMDGNPLYRAALDYNTMQARDSAQKIYYGYNEEGALSSIILFDRGTELTCELEYYNDNLNLSAVALDDYGRETEIVFELDENGKVLSESLYNTNGIAWKLEYGEGGSVAKETAYRATIEMVGIYTRNGLETKFSMSMLGSVTMDATVTYNEALLPIKNEQTAYGQTSTALYTWNDKNLCVATTALDASGAKFEYTFAYNDKDALEKETCLKYDASGNLTEKTVTEYRYNDEGKAASKVVSQYDAEGNLTNTTETTL